MKNIMYREAKANQLSFLTGMALQGILANPTWDKKVIADSKRVAFSAVDYAKAVIKEIDKQVKMSTPK